MQVESSGKASLVSDIEEIIKLVGITEEIKEETYFAYSNDVDLGSSELKELMKCIEKMKERNQQLQYENKALKNRQKALIESGGKVDRKIDKEETDVMYRVLRKLNQDAGYALDQFKEAIIQSEEDYGDS